MMTRQARSKNKNNRMVTNSANKTKARLIIFSFFLLGVLMGIGLMNFIAAKSKTEKTLAAAAKANGTKPTLLETLNAELSLNETQRSAVGELIQQQDEQVKILMKDVKPQLDNLRTLTRGKIREALTVEQQSKFDAWVKKRDEERRLMSGAAPPKAAPTK